MMNWENRFNALARMMSTWSKDPERRVGAAVVSPQRRIIGIGYNGLPHGVEDTAERLVNAETRSLMTVHAEVNAILNVEGSTREATLFSTSFPCSGCAGVIIQAGIRIVVSPPPEEDSTWASSWEVAAEMFREAGVLTRAVLPGPIDRSVSELSGEDLVDAGLRKMGDDS